VLDVPEEEVAKTYRSVGRKITANMDEIPGFRAGKVPETVIRRPLCRRNP